MTEETCLSAIFNLPHASCQEDALLRESYVLLGPGYTEHQRQRCDISVMTLALLFLLKTMETLENGLRLQSGVTPLFSTRTELLTSSQRCRSIDADT